MGIEWVATYNLGRVCEDLFKGVIAKELPLLTPFTPVSVEHASMHSTTNAMVKPIM